MKTRDGHELKIGHYYYLENGQCVCLDECATTATGEEAYVVTPFYEGGTMTVSGDGGSHCEYTAEYEHEGEPALVKSIFKVAPTDKICVRYKNELNKVEALALSVGLLTKKLNKLQLSERNFTKGEVEAKKNLCLAANELKRQTEVVDEVKAWISEKRQELSKLEDSISDLKSEDVSSMISKTELQRLNKRDFELQCLEDGGVDNWVWYSESLADFHKRYPEG